jgi:hypothetical protein
MHSEAPAKNVVIVANESLVDEASDHSRDDEEIFGQEDDLVRSLSPMLQMMRIWGLYFGRHGRFHICSQSQESQLQNTEQFECNAGGKHSTAQHGIYAKIVLLILWINVLRVTISLRGGQALDVSTISQSTLFLTYLQYAVMQTSYFIASHSGTLDQMLDRLRVTRKLAKQVRKFATACVIYNLLAFALSVASGFYTIFLPDERISFVLTPFTTLISVDGIWLKMVKILVIVVGSFSLQACLLPFLMNIMLTAILLLLFREINNRFRSKLNHRGKFTGNLKAFRHRHQVLSEIVQTIDSFMRIGNVASIACQMIIVILLLFETAFIGYVDTLIAVIFYSTFLPIVLSLSTCIISGVMVNGTVSCIGLRVFFSIKNFTFLANLIIIQVSAERLLHLQSLHIVIATSSMHVTGIR